MPWGEPAMRSGYWINSGYMDGLELGRVWGLGKFGLGGFKSYYKLLYLSCRGLEADH